MFEDHEYHTGRSVVGFAEFLGWALLIVGVIVVFVAFSAGYKFGDWRSALLAAVPMLGIVAVALIAIVFAQMARAQMDTSQRVLRLIRINRDGFQYLRNQASEVPKSFDLENHPIGGHSSAEPEKLEPQTIPYKGYDIVVDEAGRIWVGKQEVMTVAIAKRYIEDAKPLNQQGHQPMSVEPEEARAERPLVNLKAPSSRSSERTEPTLARPTP